MPRKQRNLIVWILSYLPLFLVFYSILYALLPESLWIVKIVVASAIAWIGANKIEKWWVGRDSPPPQ